MFTVNSKNNKGLLKTKVFEENNTKIGQLRREESTKRLREAKGDGFLKIRSGKIPTHSRSNDVLFPPTRSEGNAEKFKKGKRNRSPNTVYSFIFRA